jgi:epoxide hydrolase-like predicted phosphatase
MKYKAIGFDLGGVIIASALPHFFQYAQSALGVSTADLIHAFEHAKQPLERGEISATKFWHRLTSQLGVKFEPGVFLKLWTEHFLEDSPVRGEMLQLVDNLKAAGYRVGMLSNTTSEHVSLNRHRGIFEHFAVALMSNEIGTRKPEPEAYLKLAEALQVDPAEMVFIDDLEENIAGAQAVGMTGIKFSGYGPLVAELQRLGVVF